MTMQVGWSEIGWLAAAGAIGTLARYIVSGLASRLNSGEYPWGTLAVNAVGCFLFGLVWMLAEDRMLISGRTRFIVLTGFMGAFTTFSTFAFETAAMARDSEWLIAAANLLAHNVGGLALVLLGMVVGRLL
jgi:fluoride exporter